MVTSRALVACLLVASTVAACQGNGKGSAEGSGSAVGSGSASAHLVDARGPADAALPPEDTDRRRVDEPEPTPDPSKLIADLNAVPAWQAVIDRAALLGRRGQRGVVYGRLGSAVMIPAPPPPPPPPPPPGTPPPRPAAPVDAGVIASPYLWLVDDTEGNGTLGIRVELASKLAGKATEGERVALGGAWELDAAHRWFWRADALDKLPPPPASDLKEPQPAVPSHAIARGELPAGARTLSLAKDGDAVYFQIVGPAPTTEGDGWAVADELGNPTFALMNFPGERASYGGHDMRQPDERWVLRRGQTYTVRIGKLRKRTGKPALVNARTAPVRVQ